MDLWSGISLKAEPPALVARKDANPNNAAKGAWRLPVRSSLSASLLAIVLVTGTFAGRALEPTTPLAHYGRQAWAMENGLPQNTVQALAQTRQGFVWLGTEVGLVRFDGSNFATFDRNSSPALPGADVRCLMEARDGSLWVGTSEGLARWKDGSGYRIHCSERAAGKHHSRIGRSWRDGVGLDGNGPGAAGRRQVYRRDGRRWTACRNHHLTGRGWRRRTVGRHIRRRGCVSGWPLDESAARSGFGRIAGRAAKQNLQTSWKGLIGSLSVRAAQFCWPVRTACTNSDPAGVGWRSHRDRQCRRTGLPS